jgi:DNA-binding transcriptional LysR family regulator
MSRPFRQSLKGTEAERVSDAGQLPQTLRLAASRAGTEITLRKLQVFCAVARSGSLTRAAKLLGVSQPSLSQQLAGFEASIGAKLFDRVSNSLALTEFGATILAKSEHVLRAMQQLEDAVPAHGGVVRQTIRLAGVASVLRVMLPAALSALRRDFPALDFDLFEGAPEDVLEMLYSRRAHIGILAENSVSEISTGFHTLPLMTDPYVLVVPEWLDLAAVADPAELPATARAVLNSSIQFVFGNSHSQRIQAWYDRMLPDSQTVARARSFELIVDLVRGGMGVCVVPALSAQRGAGILEGVRLFAIDLDPRRIVALLPAHYAKLEPYAEVLSALERAGEAAQVEGIAAMPPFVARALTSRSRT